MTIAGMLVNIGALLLTIGSIVILKYTGILDVIIQAFDWVKYYISWMMENKIFAVCFFLFIISVFSSAISLILSFNYACDSNNQKLEMKYGILSGFAFTISRISMGLNTTESGDYQQLLNDYTVPTQSYPSTSAEGFMSVQCYAQDPKLMLFGRVDFLNYRYWVLITIIMALVGIVGKIKGW